MDRVTAEFVRATSRAHEAGFDLVELHMAHGYLLGTFLSPLTNQRDDAYGGPIENRLRYPLEVLRAVRAELARGEAALGPHLRDRLARGRSRQRRPHRGRARVQGRRAAT